MGNPVSLTITLIVIYLAVAVRGLMKNYYQIKDGEETDNTIWGKIAKKIWKK